MNPSAKSLLEIVVLTLILAAVGAIIIKHSVAEALKALKTAFKAELKTDAGRLNLFGMVLFVVAIFVFNLEQLISDSVSVDGLARSQNRVIAPGILIGLFIIGSLFCVIYLEKDKD